MSLIKHRSGVRKPVRLGLVCLFAASFVWLASCGAPPAPRAGDVNAVAQQLDQDIPQWLQQYQVPGAAVALIRNGEVVWTKGYGWANVSQRVPVTPDTVFQVASISKSVTAWGVMRLVEQGKLNLDAPVDQYLTRWHLPASSYDARGVTIRRLLSHTAGLSVHGYPGWPPEQPLPSLEASLSGQNGGGGEVRLMMEPGTQYSYSGGGYTLLQLVIEEVTGKAFAAYMQPAILDPLGMTHSSFEWRTDLRPATATGYSSTGQPLPNYLFTEQAAAGLYTTAPDLARFAAAEMAGPAGTPAGRGVLSPATLALMFTPVAPLNGLDGWAEADSIGLGHIIETLPDGTKAVGHGGTNQGWNLRFMVLPERREGIVILTNSDRGITFYAEVLGAWARWLGSGAPKVNRVLEGLHNLVLLLAAVLGLGLVARLGYLVAQAQMGGRRWVWQLPGRPTAMRIAIAVLSILIASVVGVGWWLGVHPAVATVAPGQALALTLAVLGWCFQAGVTALWQSPKRR